MDPKGETFLIWGAGGHGKVVADLVRAVGGHVAGFVDRDQARLGMPVEPGGAMVIGEAEVRERVRSGGGLPRAGAFVPAIGDNRSRLASLLGLEDLVASALVHPSATVSPSARLGDGTVVFPGAIVNAETSIGRAVIVNSSSVVEHDCVLGDGVHLSPNATLGGGVTVGRATWIGAGATVIQGIRIGEGAMVGAGATVIRDVPDGVTVVGTPARVLERHPEGGDAR